MATDKSSSGSRSLWKGAISFGLVHVPVSLHSATSDEDVDFDWLDKRSMDPVGYKRINKRTGKEVDRDNIVKGVKVDGDEYVVLSDDEIKSAYPKRTQTIAIEAFVKAVDISFVYAEKPYYLAPEAKAERVYALLREALNQAGVIGVARFVLHNKEHLAALIPAGPALMLGTLRWASEIRSAEGLGLPQPGASANGIKPGEMKMARQLVDAMTSPWKPQAFKDDFTTAIRELVRKKAQAGDKATVAPLEEAPDLKSSNVVDLSELLRQSLGSKRQGNMTSSAKAPVKAAASPSRKPRKASSGAKGTRPRKAA